jgi:hypothetical protein
MMARLQRRTVAATKAEAAVDRDAISILCVASRKAGVACRRTGGDDAAGS